MKSSELIGSGVLVLENAEICGTVSNLILSDKLKKVAYLEIFIDDEDDCEVKYISVKDVFAVERDVVTVKYAGSISAARPLGIPCPVNLPAYDECGKSLGAITDLSLDGWLVAAVETKNAVYSPSDILNRSDALVVIKRPGSTLKLGQKKKRIPTVKSIPFEERKVSITSAVKAVKFTPRPTGYSFLYGRTATRDIISLDGRLIIPQSALITPDLVGIAKINGVIAQLSLYTRPAPQDAESDAR